METFDFFAQYEYLSPEGLAVYDEFIDENNEKLIIDNFNLMLHFL